MNGKDTIGRSDENSIVTALIRIIVFIRRVEIVFLLENSVLTTEILKDLCGITEFGNLFFAGNEAFENSLVSGTNDGHFLNFGNKNFSDLDLVRKELFQLMSDKVARLTTGMPAT